MDYVIFWPQDTTWDDDAISSVARNRVTFMRLVFYLQIDANSTHLLIDIRYLTKIADQIVALVADDHVNGIVWTGEAAPEPGLESDDDDDDDDVDRLFTFEVKKTREEEENVITQPGFEVRESSCC